MFHGDLYPEEYDEQDCRGCYAPCDVEELDGEGYGPCCSGVAAGRAIARDVRRRPAAYHLTPELIELLIEEKSDVC